MAGAQAVDYVEGVQTSVVGNGPGDDFQGLGEHVHDQLFLVGNFAGVLLEASGELHLSSTSSCDDLVGLEASADDHDGVVQGTLCLLDELLSSSSQDNGGGFGLTKI